MGLCFFVVGDLELASANWARAVPIYRLLQNSAFEPEHVQADGGASHRSDRTDVKESDAGKVRIAFTLRQASAAEARHVGVASRLSQSHASKPRQHLRRSTGPSRMKAHNLTSQKEAHNFRVIMRRKVWKPSSRQSVAFLRAASRFFAL